MFKNKSAEEKPAFSDSKWIWMKDAPETGYCVGIFRRVVKVDKPPKKALIRAAAADRYFLSVNGKTAVFDGGAARFSRSEPLYYDSADISDLLVKGDNVISAVVIYHGEGAEKGGFIFECDALGIVSDSSFTVLRDDAYSAAPKSPTCFHRGVNVRYDAQRERNIVGYQKADFSSGLFEPAEEIGAYGDEPWGELLPNILPEPSFKTVEKARRVEKSAGVLAGDRYADVYVVPLPCAMSVYPRFTVTASGGDKIEVRTDRYESYGCYDDEKKIYGNLKFEYICKAETQTFEFPQCLYGEKLIVSAPQSVKVSSVGYRSVAYGSEESGYFRSNDAFVGELYEKSANTLISCMQSSLIDSPERGGALFPALASLGADAANYLMKDGGIPLIRKVMTDMLRGFEGDAPYFDVYGARRELPAQTLVALSGFGIAARYFAYVGADGLLDEFSLAALKYLCLWETDGDGLAVRRKNESIESDKLLNCDDRLIISMLYCSALNNVRVLREAAGDTNQTEFLRERAQTVRSAIEGFFDGVGYTTVKGRYDERAAALAVLCDVAQEDKYDSIAAVLESVACATPLYEGYVLQALCRIGRGDTALSRMKSRYHAVSDHGSTTLFEDFSCKGARCYLGSVAPLTVLYRCFAGIDFARGLETVTLTPDLRSLSEIEFGTDLGGGRLCGKFAKVKDRVEIVVENGTGRTVALVLKSANLGRDIDGLSEKTVQLGKGKSKITV